MIATALVDEGFEVIEASSSDEGAELLIHPDLDFIYTDVRMPGAMDGIDLALRTRENSPSDRCVSGSEYAPRLFERLDKLDQPPVFFGKPCLSSEIIRAMLRITRDGGAGAIGEVPLRNRRRWQRPRASSS
jgi:two-component SAPR family response regulator